MIKIGFRGVFIGLLFLCILDSAWADGEPLGELATTSLEAREKAIQYSFETGGIGIVIGYGAGNGVSAEYIGNSFVEEIKKRDMNSRYFFFINKDWEGVAMEFSVRYSSFGPWNSDYAASQISKVVERAQAARIVHED